MFPVAVNPVPAAVTFTAPPPRNELDANWAGLPLFPGQAFVADFTLPTGLTPLIILAPGHSTGSDRSGNPGLTTFTRLPEPSTLSLLGLGLLSLLGMWIRRRNRKLKGSP